MNYIIQFSQQTFASLKIRNYRLYFIGQGLSMCGTWMQTVALGWLVLTLTGSGTKLGVVMAFQYFPMLIGGLWGGSIVDRFNKRYILYVTQSILALLALSMSILVWTNVVTIDLIYFFAFLTGIVTAIDNPARQTFVHETVGRENLRNAVTLASTENNLARAIGPLIAGTLIAGVGIAACFLMNALSFIAVLVILSLIRAEDLHMERSHEKKVRVKRSILSYIASKPEIKHVLILVAILGTVTYEFQISLPLIAQKTFLGDAATYATLLSAMGIGSVVGGMLVAGRKKTSFKEFVIAVFCIGLTMCVTAVMPTLALSTLGMLFVGFFSIQVLSVGNTIVQLGSSEEMRGRVMSLWSMAMFGSTLVGGPLIGMVGEYIGPRWGLGIGGIVAIMCALVVAITMYGITHLYHRMYRASKIFLYQDLST
jgi:MFS family permease